MNPVGFVGLGRMGLPMARHLVTAGFEVIGVDVSDSARERARSAGVEVTSDLALLRDAEVVITSLPDTPQVIEVYSEEFLATLAPDALCLDMSTIDVVQSRALAGRVSAKGCHFLDSPVSGTSIHAEAGTLVVMIGGEDEAAERARRYLEPFASAVYHVGGNGMGLEMKLITNRLLTSSLVAIAEAIIEMEEAGLDTAEGLSILAAGAVPKLLDYKASPMAMRDHTPLFTVDLMSKDLSLARKRREPMPLGQASHEVMASARDLGMGDMDVSAVIEVLERLRSSG